MHRCSFCEWIPILPLPVWPLAGQVLLGQHVVVGSMTLLLAVRGNIATRSMSGPPFALQLHRTTVWCGATVRCHMQLPFVACKVVRNGGDLSLSRGTATVEGGDAVARGRWADALSDLSAGYTDTTHHRTIAHLEPGDGGGASGGRAVSGT